jgi:hypothetical protein
MAVHTYAVRTKLVVQFWFFTLAGFERIFYWWCTRHLLAVSRFAPSLGFWRRASKDLIGVIVRGASLRGVQSQGFFLPGSIFPLRGMFYSCSP